MSQIEASATPPTLYNLEERTQAALSQIGQVLLQEVVCGQGAGVVGPERPCACGDQQRYHDQARRISVQTSVGIIQNLLPESALVERTPAPGNTLRRMGPGKPVPSYLSEVSLEKRTVG